MDVGCSTFILWQEKDSRRGFHCRRMNLRALLSIPWLGVLECGWEQADLAEGLFQEGEEDGEDDAEEGDDVVPMDGLSLEDEGDDDGEDREGDDLLDDL